MSSNFIVDPIAFQKELWPNRRFYAEQQQIVYSVCDTVETYVPAGNGCGKDYVAGFIIVWFFLTRTPCRIVTTSAKEDHLRVLWGEVNDWIQSCKYPLDYKRGGPLIINHQELRKVFTSGPNKGQKCSKSYVVGLVASPDSVAALQGHHQASPDGTTPMTLFVADECSSVPETYYNMAASWRHRSLFIGNTWNGAMWWQRHIEEGDIYVDEDNMPLIPTITV